MTFASSGPWLDRFPYEIDRRLFVESVPSEFLERPPVLSLAELADSFKGLFTGHALLEK
jgi:hypothetical protein